MTTILVTGATGAVGPRVVGELHLAGYGLRTLSLDPPQPGSFPEGVQVFAGDITDPSALQAAVQGVHAVVHMAALLHIVDPPPELRRKYEQVNVGGTAAVVDAALRAGVQRLVFFSTIAVYGPTQGHVVDEESPPRPDTYYAHTKLAAEKIVLAARRADGQALGSVLRLGAVYGARIKGNYRRLLLSLARGRFVPIGNGRNRRTLVYDSDVARAVHLVVEHPAAAGRIYNVTGGSFHPLSEILTVMCSALGKPPPRLSIPTAPARFAAGLVEDTARFAGKHSPIVRSTIDKYIEDVAVDGRRLREELGFNPLYSLKDGWGETVLEMRQKGEL
jgi:nucleoside-diphosphate-sugar epimerase